MKVSIFTLPVFLLLAALSGCSSTQDRFISAALKEGTVTDQRVLQCAAGKLERELGDEDFSRLADDLERIADREIWPSQADMRLLGTMTVTTGTCAVAGLLGRGDEAGP